MITPMIEIRNAEFPKDADEVNRLFREYADSLGVDLGFQNFDDEVTSLPGKYAPPGGRLLLAWKGDDVLGCIALRPLQDTTCEMKRLYVRPQARGMQLGRKLAGRLCDEARAAGYTRMCLDTLPTMATAQGLYRSMGFEPIDPYVFNPIEGTRFLALALDKAAVD